MHNKVEALSHPTIFVVDYVISHPKLHLGVMSADVRKAASRNSTNTTQPKPSTHTRSGGTRVCLLQICQSIPSVNGPGQHGGQESSGSSRCQQTAPLCTAPTSYSTSLSKVRTAHGAAGIHPYCMCLTLSWRLARCQRGRKFSVPGQGRSCVRVHA